MKKNYFILIMLASGFILFSKEYKYEDILNLIENNNYTVKKVEAMSNSMKAMVNVEGLDFMDTSLEYSMMDLDFNNNGFDPNEYFHQVSLMQTFPVSARLFFNRKAKEMEYINTVEEVKQKKILIKKMVFELIMELYKNENMKINMLQENAAIKSLLETARSQYSTGKIILAYVVEIELKLSESDKNLIETEKMIALLKNEASSILNLQDNDFSYTINQESLKSINVSGVDSANLYQRFIKFNPDYKMSDNNIAMYENQYKSKLQNLIPDLGLGVDYKLKPNPMIDNMLDFNVAVNIPLLSIPKRAGELKYLQGKKSEMVFEKKELENNIKNYLERNVIDLKSTVNQLKLLNDRVLDLSDANISIIINSFRSDKADINMLLDTIVMNYDLKNNYFEYLEKYFKILFDIESLTGEKYYNL